MRCCTLEVGATGLLLALSCSSLGCGSFSSGSDGDGGAGGTSAGGTSAGGSSAGGSSAGGSSAGGTNAGGSDGGQGAEGGASLCGDAELVAAYPNCAASDTEQACASAGGSWTTVGPGDYQMCVCPTGQNGCSCTRAAHCVAGCRAETLGGVMECDGVTAGECASHAPWAGCWCLFTDSDVPAGYCID